MVDRFVLGLDFGGTKLAAGVVNVTELRLIDSAVRSTNTEDGAEGAVAAMIGMARGLLSVEKVDHIGVCFGGPVVRNRIVRSLHIPGWQDFPIHERLRAHFGDIPIRVANDANAVALGEFKYGAGRGATAMLFLTVSTGVGGAVILNGSLWEGSARVRGGNRPYTGCSRRW